MKSTDPTSSSLRSFLYSDELRRSSITLKGVCEELGIKGKEGYSLAYHAIRGAEKDGVLKKVTPKGERPERWEVY